MLEQLLGLERLAEEYGKVGKEGIDDNIKFRVMLAVVRQYLQVVLGQAGDGSFL